MGFMDSINKIRKLGTNINKVLTPKPVGVIANVNTRVNINQPNETYNQNTTGYNYIDADGDGTPDMLQQRPKTLHAFSNKDKEYNGPRLDKHGCYIPKATYPLPPVNHDKKMFKENNKIRNKNNIYLD